MGQILAGVFQHLGGECIQGCDGATDDRCGHGVSHREPPELAAGRTRSEGSILKLPRLHHHRLAEVDRAIVIHACLHACMQAQMHTHCQVE